MRNDRRVVWRGWLGPPRAQDARRRYRFCHCVLCKSAASSRLRLMLGQLRPPGQMVEMADLLTSCGALPPRGFVIKIVYWSTACKAPESRTPLTKKHDSGARSLINVSKKLSCKDCAAFLPVVSGLLVIIRSLKLHEPELVGLRCVFALTGRPVAEFGKLMNSIEGLLGRYLQAPEQTCHRLSPAPYTVCGAEVAPILLGAFDDQSAHCHHIPSCSQTLRASDVATS